MMTAQTVLRNAKIVLPDEVVTGTVTLRDGVIEDISTGPSSVSDALDCEGAFLAPGLIELHTDNLERHIQPRPKVDWPHRAAIVAHDREMASAGITTVFDAIRVGSILSDQGKKRYGKYARQIADEIHGMRQAGALKISHHIHLRAEVCSETLVAELEEFTPADKIGILSLMDHTPGQRQFRDLKKFEDYVCGKNGLSRENFGEYITFLHGLQTQFGTAHEAAAVAAAKRLGATLASHDDTTTEQVMHSESLGVTVAEFPTTLEAAAACCDADMATVLGAPNLVRGGSHSGNVAAEELANLRQLDILSSDYVPAALLQGALMLADRWEDMAQGIATVTVNPARSVGLSDRGQIAIGKRADLILFDVFARTAILRAVWLAGGRIS